jgi:hypothetical protein
MNMIEQLLGILGNLFGNSSANEREEAERLNASESDKDVSYIVVRNWDDVGNILMDMVMKHNGDVADYDNYTFMEYYDMVRNLPYIADQKKAGDFDLDVFCRPKRTLSENAVCRDCDDKAILMACWLIRHNIPFKFIACAYEEGHHVEHCILKAMVNGRTWQYVDSTYEDDSFPSWRKYWNIVEICEWRPD